MSEPVGYMVMDDFGHRQWVVSLEAAALHMRDWDEKQGFACDAKVYAVVSLELPEPPELLPAEKMALTVASAQVRRGDAVPPNTATMLVMALERLTASTEPPIEDAGSGGADRSHAGYEVMRCPHCGSNEVECHENTKHHAHRCNACGALDVYRGSGGVR